MSSINSAVAGRPNVYLGHDAVRAAVGYTPSLGSGDINGDGEADLLLGLHSGTQNPDSGVAHDGEVVLDGSLDGAHVLLIAEQTSLTRFLRFGLCLPFLGPAKILQAMAYQGQLLGVLR